MNWWFGRKSAPDGRGFVPAFLLGEAGGDGFARGYAAQLDEVYRAQSGRAARGAAGRGDGRRAADLCARRARRGGRRWSTRDGLLEEVAAGLLLHGNAYVQLIADERDAAGRTARAAARAGQRGDRRGGLAGGLSSIAPGGQGGADRAGAMRSGGARWRMSGRSTRATTIMGWAASRRRSARRACTIAPAAGTRRCSTMRRGRRGR